MRRTDAYLAIWILSGGTWRLKSEAFVTLARAGVLGARLAIKQASSAIPALDKLLESCNFSKASKKDRDSLLVERARKKVTW